jgi:hypothetical protein
MKSRALTCVFAMTLFAALALPAPLAAQEQKEAKKHHRYRFVDLGTFGGPESYINNAMAIGAPNQINRRGTTVGSSAIRHVHSQSPAQQLRLLRRPRRYCPFCLPRVQMGGR